MTAVTANKATQVQELMIRAKSSMAAYLPNVMSHERLMRLAMAATRDPKLARCKPISIVECMVLAAKTGLEPGLPGQAALVPFKDEFQFIPEFQGLVELARRSGKIGAVWANVIYEKDDYEIAEGSEPKLTHKPDYFSDDRGKALGAYACARFTGTGEIQWTFVPVREINKIMKGVRSSSNAASPWKQHWDEMAKKPAGRRLCKLLPLSSEDRGVMAAAETHEEQVKDADVQAILSDVEDPPQGDPLAELTKSLESGESLYEKQKAGKA